WWAPAADAPLSRDWFASSGWPARADRHGALTAPRPSRIDGAQRHLQIGEGHAAAQIVLDLLQHHRATHPLRTGLEYPLLDQRGEKEVSGREQTVAQRVEQMLFQLHRVLDRRQNRHGLQIERIVFAKPRIGTDAFLVVVLERAAEGVAD